MKYIHYFKTAAEFSQAEANVADSEPWVSYCERYSLLTYSPALDIEAVANGHQYVDLGLPSGTLWATCNVGANSPEEYGGYYAWLETESKSVYSNSTYNTNYFIEHYSENDEVLHLEDDVANVVMGGKWRMPTSDECSELMYNTTQSSYTLNGVQGIIFVGANENSIFLPYAGYYEGSRLYDVNRQGILWTSSLYSIAFGADSGSVHYPNQSDPWYGWSVRGVLSSRRWYNPLVL